MSNDPEYDAMMRDERKTKRIFRQRHYRHVEVACCENCQYVEYGYEGERDCRAIETEYGNHSVSNLGICDNWREALAHEATGEKA
jgi:hypothetical protein